MTGDLAPWADCAEMTYKPRSRPNFPGDIQHDLRDCLYDRREETISTWINWAVDDYLQAARLLNRMDDPVADTLPYAFPFDMAIFQVAHDQWRPIDANIACRAT